MTHAKLPKELGVALRADSEAKRLFAQMSNSGRKEYAQWIGEAKQPETRARRAAQAIDRIRENQASAT